MANEKILVVDDDTNICELLRLCHDLLRVVLAKVPLACPVRGADRGKRLGLAHRNEARLVAPACLGTRVAQPLPHHLQVVWHVLDLLCLLRAHLLLVLWMLLLFGEVEG